MEPGARNARWLATGDETMVQTAMSAVSTHFLIEPRQATEKFLVDMRLTSERTFRRWQRVLIEAIDDCPLSPRERAALLQSHPIDDYFFAGMVALHAYGIR